MGKSQTSSTYGSMTFFKVRNNLLHDSNMLNEKISLLIINENGWVM